VFCLRLQALELFHDLSTSTEAFFSFVSKIIVLHMILSKVAFSLIV